MYSPRSVTINPSGSPLRILKPASDLRATVILGLRPVITFSCSSTFLRAASLFCSSLTRVLTTIFSSLATE